MSQVWDEFVDQWAGVANADEARDGIERITHDRPKTKAAAVDAAVRLFGSANGSEEVEEIAAELLSEIRADGIRQWAKDLTGQSLNKNDGIELILDEYLRSDDRPALRSDDRLARRALRSNDDDERRPAFNDDASKAILRCGKRRTTSKEYFGIGAIGTDSSWRSQDLIVSGQCLKCRKATLFNNATAQNLAATASQLLDLVNPMKWISVATKADFNFYRCSLCGYLQKVCAECDEICETTASQCKGCGHAFG